MHCRKKIINKVITIVGGVHTEKFPEDIEHDSTDYRVVRNAIRSFPHLMDYIAGTQKFPIGVPMKDNLQLDIHRKPEFTTGVLRNEKFPMGVLRKGEKLDESRLPDYDFYSIVPDRSHTARYRSRYFYVFHNKVALMKASFGCPYHFNFCFCRKITDDQYYARLLDEVIDKLAVIKEKEVYLVDDDFLVNAERVLEFIRLVKERRINKKYLVYGMADFIGKHPEIIRQFKAIGLRTVIVGLESFEDDELNDFHKQTDSNTNKQAMGVLSRHGVNCYAGIILLPSWTAADFRKAGDIMIDLGIMFVNLRPLTSLKGTGIIINEKDLVIKWDDFAKWELAHVAIRPDNISVEEYYRNMINLYYRIVFHPKNMLRLLKYSVRMQIRMANGLRKVIRQYKEKIMEVSYH